MNRNEVTTAASLRVGDRFYKASDKHKLPYILVANDGRKPVCCEGFVYDHPVITAAHKERNYKPIKADTQVVFLRHSI